MLTIHKNTRVQRRAKDLRKQLMATANSIKKLENISGFSMVVWDSDLSFTDCGWSAGDSMPGLMVPELSKQILSTKLGIMATNDVIDKRFS